MQRKAALWVTGAFCTSPTGGVEALASLIPIDLHLKKMASRANLRVHTLTSTHPTCSLLLWNMAKLALPHPLSFANLPGNTGRKVKGPIADTVRSALEYTEPFNYSSDLARPGERVRDLFSDQIIFDERPRKKQDEEASEDDDRIAHLDELYLECREDTRTVSVATDATVPPTSRHQAVSGYGIYTGGRLRHRARFASGRVTAPDAELTSIRFAVEYLVMRNFDCDRIVVFTDSIAAAKRSVDPSIHSGQVDSLVVCKHLTAWLSKSVHHSILFVEVPSKAEWGIHFETHQFVWDLLSVRVGPTTITSLDYLRKQATSSCQDAWVSRFQHSSYRGSQFLEMKGLKGKSLQPSYIKGGTWLSKLGDSNTLVARAVRCITNHAPVGEYYRRFNIPNTSRLCTCWSAENSQSAVVQTRTHVLHHCPDVKHFKNIDYVVGLAQFLKKNPQVFSFGDPAPRAGDGNDEPGVSPYGVPRKGGPKLRKLRHRARFASGRVTAPDAELTSIRFAVEYLSLRNFDCNRIVVFTDSIAAAKRAVDPSIHSGQADSLVVCKYLMAWLSESAYHSILFVEVPSKAEWGIHYEAHQFVRDLPSVRVGPTTVTSLDYLRKQATASCQDAWVSRFQHVTYRGSQFLEMKGLQGKPLQPSYIKGGTWLSKLGDSNALVARVVRCITNHAPVGEYYHRFNIPNTSRLCTCWSAENSQSAVVQTRTHILHHCPDVNHSKNIDYVVGLAQFLKKNPRVFSFADPAPRAGVG
ncbi:hypothetical protein L218DRAFT_1004637 [Marasmius fiardii PR-910]|nr:hypothetical protein L218DRAFT_1004637 [Marasmius fiardii PR-910]